MAVGARLLSIWPGVWDQEGLAQVDPGRALTITRAESLRGMPWQEARAFDIQAYLAQLIDAAREARVEGVLGTGDYPASLLQAYVAAALELPGPPVEVALRFSHKLYSRELQRRLVPEATPEFVAFDPADAQAASASLFFPCFIKPVKGTMSMFASRVNDPRELHAALQFDRKQRWDNFLWLRPYQALLDAAGLGHASAFHFLAESPLAGVQVTVEGFVQHGRATIMGIVDSVMFPGSQSFARFDYPSRLPAPVLARMGALVTRLIEGSGFDHSLFNVELYWDQARDRIAIIEVNPRMSYQFSDLFLKVDGTASYAVQLAIALGEAVVWRAGRGAHRVASSLVLRRFSDARVRAVPSEAMIAAVKARDPDAVVQILCAPGQRLSQLSQDVGSFRYGIVNLGAASWDALETRWQETQAGLRFEWD